MSGQRFESWMQPFLTEWGPELWDEYQRRQAGEGFNRHGSRSRVIGGAWTARQVGVGERRGKKLARYVMQHGPFPRHPGRQSGLERITPRKVDGPIEDLLDRCQDAYARKAARADKEVAVKVRESKPFGVLVLGDPHLGDDGCDIGMLREHVELIQNTPGLFGACVGDWRNNWVGRLVAEYAHSSTSRGDTIRLMEWLMSSVQWAWVIMGNHDHWNNGAELWAQLLKGCNHEASGQYDVKLRLETEGCEPIRIWCRHDFPGRSQFHPTHGAIKALWKTDYPADLYIQGHRHTHGSMSLERAGRMINLAVVGTYKREDNYARQLGYEPDESGQAYLVILDPWADGISRVFGTFDIRTGVEMLNVMRNRGQPRKCEG